LSRTLPFALGWSDERSAVVAERGEKAKLMSVKTLQTDWSIDVLAEEF